MLCVPKEFAQGFAGDIFATGGSIIKAQWFVGNSLDKKNCSSEVLGILCRPIKLKKQLYIIILICPE